MEKADFKNFPQFCPYSPRTTVHPIFKLIHNNNHHYYHSMCVCLINLHARFTRLLISLYHYFFYLSINHPLTLMIALVVHKFKF